METKTRKPRSKETISYMMSRIRGKDTGIEVTLRKELYKRGYRYRNNTGHIFGHPDISFKGAKVVVFCDSEFWHGYNFEENKKNIHSNLDYWIPKIERNIQRDIIVNERLKKEGYTILRFWGKEITDNLDGVVEQIIKEVDKAKALESLKTKEKELTTLGYLEKDGQYLMLLRNKKKVDENANKYIGVGGHLEKGESPLACFKREAQEETGLFIASAQYKGYVDFYKIGRDRIERMYLYTSSDFSGEMIECNEGTLEWIDKDKINDLPLWEGDRVFLPLLGKNDGTFHITLIYDEDDNLIETIGPSYDLSKKPKKKKKRKKTKIKTGK